MLQVFQLSTNTRRNIHVPPRFWTVLVSLYVSHRLNQLTRGNSLVCIDLAVPETVNNIFLNISLVKYCKCSLIYQYLSGFMLYSQCISG